MSASTTRRTVPCRLNSYPHPIHPNRPPPPCRNFRHWQPGAPEVPDSSAPSRVIRHWAHLPSGMAEISERGGEVLEPGGFAAEHVPGAADVVLGGAHHPDGQAQRVAAVQHAVRDEDLTGCVDP